MADGTLLGPRIGDLRKMLNSRVVAVHAGDTQRSTTGPIGLQLHDPFSIVMVRNIRITELAR